MAGTPSFHGIDLEIRQDEFVVLVGPSGYVRQEHTAHRIAYTALTAEAKMKEAHCNDR